MKRLGAAFLYTLLTTLAIYAGLFVLAWYSPRHVFIDFILDTDASGQDPKLIDFLISDLRDMMLKLATAVAVAVLLASWLWLLRSSRADIAIPGEARRYGWSWRVLALTGAAGAAAFAGYLSFGALYFEILRVEARWMLTAAVIPVSLAAYWLVTAIWTPSLQAPAVQLSGLFRWIRRPLAL